jgi:hypothetical protein
MKRTLMAFVMAPLVPPLVYWVLHFAPDRAALPGVMLYGGLVGYLAIAITVVPAYVLIRTHSRLRLGQVLGIAAVVGAVTLSLMSQSPLEVQTVLGGALYGLSAGASFWLVWRRNAAQPAVAADGTSRRR